MIGWLLLGALLSAGCGSPSEDGAPRVPVQAQVPLLRQVAGTSWHCDGLAFLRGYAGQESDAWLHFHDHERSRYYFWLSAGRHASSYCISEMQGRYRVTDGMTRDYSLLACQEEEWATLEMRREADGLLKILNPNEHIEVRCEQVERPEVTPEDLERLLSLD